MATIEVENPAVKGRISLPVVLPGIAAWLIMALALAWTFSPDPWIVEPPDPDSQLRLVQVRDLLAGQGWFDGTQYRLGLDGVAMHWSRLVDAPIAALVMAGGEKTALFAWPLGLYLGFVTVALLVAFRLGGANAVLPAAILSVLNIDIITHFIPGRLDHHNVQLVLLLLLVHALLSARSDRNAGIVSALALAAMVTIGVEALPYAATAGAFLSLVWALDENSGPDRRLTAFGITFAVALLAFYLLFVPAGGAARCDAFSAAYLAAGMIGGFGLAGLSIAAARHGPMVRLAGLAAVAAIIAVLTVLIFPACLAGPLGNISAELKTEWLDGVAEAQPLWAYAAVFPVQAFASFAAPVLATIIACRRVFAARRAPQSNGLDGAGNRWICITAFLIAALLLSVYQYRGTPFLNAISIPVLAVWIADWRQRAETGLAGPMRAIAIVAVWLGGLQVTYLAAGQAVASIARPSKPAAETGMNPQQPKIRRAAAGANRAERECVDPASARALASLPAGRVLSPLFYGSTILALSDHSALAGPYHRAETPILDTVRAGAGSDRLARSITRRNGIDYVVICPTSREALLTVQEQETGFFVALMQGRPAPWLEAVPVENSYLQLYKVR